MPIKDKNVIFINSEFGLTTFDSPPCHVCGDRTRLTVRDQGWKLWLNGAPVQDAFSDIDLKIREIIISGTHPACWGSMFGEDEDEPDQPTSFLVEFTPDQMRTFWLVCNGYEEACLGWWEEGSSDDPDEYPEDRARLRSVQSAVENARPIWDY